MTHVRIVSVLPADTFISALSGSASFTCATSAGSNDLVDSVQWLVNGTIFEDLELDNVRNTIELGSLRFWMLTARYNNTRIKCRGTLLSGSVFTSTRASLLIIQG